MTIMLTVCVFAIAATFSSAYIFIYGAMLNKRAKIAENQMNRVMIDMLNGNAAAFRAQLETAYNKRAESLDALDNFKIDAAKIIIIVGIIAICVCVGAVV